MLPLALALVNSLADGTGMYLGFEKSGKGALLFCAACRPCLSWVLCSEGLEFPKSTVNWSSLWLLGASAFEQVFARWPSFS